MFYAYNDLNAIARVQTQDSAATLLLHPKQGVAIAPPLPTVGHTKKNVESFVLHIFEIDATKLDDGPNADTTHNLQERKDRCKTNSFPCHICFR